MKSLIPDDIITTKIYSIRNKEVMLDKDLALLYGVRTKRLKEQVKRNINRFPDHFMFELTDKEFNNLRSQFATSNRGGTRYPPLAFTEHGILMLSSVLNNETAIQVNIRIMEVFVLMRKMAINYKKIMDVVKQMEADNNTKFADIYKAIKYLLSPKNKRERIGFRIKEEK